MSQDKYEKFRQFIASFLTGPNADAMIRTLADDAERLENLSRAVTDQLTISTASSIYLDKRLSDKGVTRPPELGMSDLAFRNMGIQITAAKQIPELIHVILETFYGEQAVRANVTNTVPGPYNLEDGMDLQFTLEDGITRTVTFLNTDFNNINQATAGEIASVITRFIRIQNLNAFAQVTIDPNTGEEYVRLFGGAKGPYSSVSVTGGEANTILQFPNIRGTELDVNDTAWEITRTVGSTLRFRWVGNSKPALDLVFPGDTVMIYGQNFESLELAGTFLVSNLRPPGVGPSLDAGWFEIEAPEFTGLKPVQPGFAPPPDNPPDFIYSYTIIQSSWYELMFANPELATPNRQIRYALAWEPRDDLLKIYMPATTQIVSRGLLGSSRLHMLYDAENLNGSFGSVSDELQAVQVVSDKIIRYKQNGFDNKAVGGTLSWGGNNIPIETVHREQFITTVHCLEPHGLPVTIDSYGRSVTFETVSVTIDRTAIDDPVNKFPTPYMVDPEASYAIRSEFVTTRSKVFAGSTLSTIEVDGTLPNEPGELLFDLNKDTQEGPVRYVGVQIQGAPNVVNITSISQNGFTLTITTDAPHGALNTSSIVVSGTTYFDGVYEVNNVPNPNTIVAISAISQIQNQVGVGTVSVVTDNLRSTVLLDPSNEFKFDHEAGADLTLLSSRNAYIPSRAGTDYPFYVTGVAEGRVFANEIIEQITALGINLEIVIVYPNDVGLGNQGGSDDPNDPLTSDKVYVWGV